MNRWMGPMLTLLSKLKTTISGSSNGLGIRIPFPLVPQYPYSVFYSIGLSLYNSVLRYGVIKYG